MMSADDAPPKQILTRQRLAWTASAVLVVIQAVLLVQAAWDNSDTVDETTYIASSVLLWAHGDFAYNAESPVLPKWAIALAIRSVDRSIDWAPPDPVEALHHVLWYGPTSRLRRNLFAARAPTILLLLAAGLFLRASARRFGEAAAVVAHALWCLSPTVLAQGSLASLDAWAAGVLAVELWSVVRFVERRSLPRLALSGAVLGLAAATKLTALGAAPVVLAVALWPLGRAALPRRAVVRSILGRVAVLVLSALVGLWAVYGFRLDPLVVGPDAHLPRALRGLRLGAVPFSPWIAGFLEQLAHGARGHTSYLFGKVSRDGWWWFYIAALGLKTTIGAQALALLLTAAWLRRPPRGAAALVDVALLAYPLLLLVVLSSSHTQLGIRYLLPAFPCAVVWAGRSFPRLAVLAGRRAGPALGVLALLLGAGEAIRLHPHYLMFFNLWAGGPTGGPRYLVVSDDWGQDQRRLAEWMRRNAVEWVYYMPLSVNGNAWEWGITFAHPPCLPKRGVYALQVSEVYRPRRLEPGCLDWLTVDPPDERVGYTIYIYRVTKGRLARLRSAAPSAAPFWRSGEPPLDRAGRAE